MIRTITITYLKNFVALYLACKLILSISGEAEVGSIIMIIVTGFPLILFPFWSYIFLMKNKDNLDHDSIKEKYSALYSNLKYENL